MAFTRRSFLKLGLVSAAVLAAGGAIYRATRAPLPPAFVLDAGARDVLDAVIPVLLDQALPQDASRAQAIADTRQAVHQAILGLNRHAQKEVQDLFGLLALGPVRRFLAGVPEDWRSASPEQVAAFLNSWRTHRIADLRPAYGALHDLVLGCWYANPASWPGIGYPGPIKELS